mmetsp:Transcript_949/g.2403  ORF Transcript_949/g.2403 Transcript_949/m.2403 type:complete len:95 (-) Transcript_949:389-673(-)
MTARVEIFPGKTMNDVPVSKSRLSTGCFGAPAHQFFEKSKQKDEKRDRNGECRRFTASMFQWDKCRCGRKKDDPCHSAVHHCLVCNEKFTAVLF